MNGEEERRQGEGGDSCLGCYAVFNRGPCIDIGSLLVCIFVPFWSVMVREASLL